jgi:putative Holliday junction resolvase
VGLPVGLDGEENEWCREVRDLGEKLARRLDVPLAFVDERLTSVRAERAVRSMGLPKRERERKERVDAAAAQLILQAWLDRPEIAR